MNNQTQIAAVDSPNRRVRGRFRWLGGAVVLVLGLILAGAIYEFVSEATDIRAYPPPGQMVDVGGYRLHINCTGEGSPTVVIDSAGNCPPRGVGCSPKSPRPRASAPTIEPGRDGARPVPSRGLPGNMLKSCIPCWQKPMNPAHMC